MATVPVMVGAIAAAAVKSTPPILSAATVKFAVAGLLSVKVSVAVPFVTVSCDPENVVVVRPDMNCSPARSI